MELTRYADWRPTVLDAAGAFLGDDRRDWLVAPCSHTRDSDDLDESNWDCQAVALADADPDGSDHETYSFGHWGPGWIEIAIVRPGSPAAAAAVALAERLERHPVLDEDDHAAREWSRYCGHWSGGAACRELARELVRRGLLGDLAAAVVGEGDPDTVRAWAESIVTSGDYYDSSNGCFPHVRYVAETLGHRDDCRSQLAGLLRTLRVQESV